MVLIKHLETINADIGSGCRRKSLIPPPLGRAAGKHQLQSPLLIAINDDMVAIEAAGLLYNVADTKMIQNNYSKMTTFVESNHRSHN